MSEFDHDSNSSTSNQRSRWGNADPNLDWERICDSQVELKPPSTDATFEDMTETKSCTRLVLVSDTHNQHACIDLPPGDVLIHAGDATMTGKPDEMRSVNAWFGELRGTQFSEIIAIAGNHDVTLDTDYYRRAWSKFHDSRLERVDFQNCIYLQDSGTPIHTAAGKSNPDKSPSLKVYGSPYTPEFYDWAFNKDRGIEIASVWEKIPDDTDILITHGPPLGRGDLVPRSGRTGCYDLLTTIQRTGANSKTAPPPRVHVFGHIHEGAGVTYDGHTLYCNACSVTENYNPLNPALVIDVPHDKSKPAMVVRPSVKLKGS